MNRVSSSLLNPCRKEYCPCFADLARWTKFGVTWPSPHNEMWNSGSVRPKEASRWLKVWTQSPFQYLIPCRCGVGPYSTNFFIPMTFTLNQEILYRHASLIDLYRRTVPLVRNWNFRPRYALGCVPCTYHIATSIRSRLIWRNWSGVGSYLINFGPPWLWEKIPRIKIRRKKWGRTDIRDVFEGHLRRRWYKIHANTTYHAANQNYFFVDEWMN